jgi:hypothetical protein
MKTLKHGKNEVDIGGVGFAVVDCLRFLVSRLHEHVH